MSIDPRPPAPAFDRRDFLKKLTVASTCLGLGPAGPIAAGQPADPIVNPPAKAPRDPFVGIQMGPHSLLDEGVDHVLDLIRDTAAVNAVLTYSHAYNGSVLKTDLADDHGVPPRDPHHRHLPVIWVKPHEQFYRDTPLRHPTVTPDFEYADHDLFAEMLAPARRRGMKVYARVLESSAMAGFVTHFDRVVTRDIDGRPTTTACWNHPDYIAFWADTVEDLFRNYELDGLQWGAERMGPLINVILPWNNDPPACFCEHCCASARRHNIDPDRAREGFAGLYRYVQARIAGQPPPADGIFTGFLRVLFRYPEILAWEYQYRLSREELCAAMYRRGKSVKPDAQIGWHVDHEPSSWDLVYRAEMSYEEMAPHSDFIKFIAYHAVLGPRIREWYLARFQKTILGELPLADSLSFYYDVFGYHKSTEPALDELGHRGFSPQYVYDETKRSVASANGKTKIYTGIGFDVPHSAPDDPATVEEATRKAFEAGADGIVVSRDYQEMHVPNLKAVGRAVRSLAGA
ncbi:MAG TPA: twin-arginine translocation signal domain-containing protein [Opitutus sp.]|nr:twin-arginine translocation signal domain-containing protein [Opitutus sp.]